MKDSQRKAMFANLNRSRSRSRSRSLKFVTPPPFKSSNHLPVQLTVLVPSTRFDKELDAATFSKRVDAEKRWFDKRFGGDTAVKDVGSYLMDGKKLIKEKGVIVEASTTTDKYKKFQREFARHVERRAKDWSQQTILSSVEGQKFIVPKQDFIDDEKKPVRKLIVT